MAGTKAVAIGSKPNAGAKQGKPPSKRGLPIVTVLGGGSGRFTLLEGLKKQPVKINAIVTMTDSGGSSGRLRTELGVLPPGDVRQCLVALSNSPKLMLDLFNYRFGDGSSLSGHNFGNLFLTALEKTTGDFEKAIDEAGRMLDITGNVIPVTLDKAELCAELADGSIVEGETNIDIPSGKRPKIRRVFLRPEAKASPKAIAAVRDSDLIVIGPGDLYTSIIPNLLVSGMTKAICSSRARKVFVLPLATKHGETDGFSGRDFVTEIEKYAGCKMDAVIVNSTAFSKDTQAKYAREGASQVAAKAPDFAGYELISCDLLSNVNGMARHDANKIASTVMSLVGPR
ncbi:MAG: uridine diphosphate-N-acetylglucosamine-binding protein YvcK [Candidatus Micrarchaeia archaeon]